MDPLTVGVQQLISLTCGSMFVAWFVLAVGEFLGRVLMGALKDWID